MTRRPLVLAVFAGIWLGATTSRAQEPGEAPPPAATARPAQGLAALYSNGFVLRSPDERNELRIAASGQLDTRYYPDRSGTPDGFDIRRARLDLGAKVLGFVDIRMQAALEDQPYIRNLFLDLGVHRWFHVRVGQMKVPFSTAWLTLDNHLDFLERPTAEPVYPFFDRGIMAWGELLGRRLVYNVGIFQGAGLDLDAPKGDTDHKKEFAYRLFAQPFRRVGPNAIRGLFLAGSGTWGNASFPVNRFEGKGLTAADYESQVWRWRFQQVIGTTGRNVDQASATIGSKHRWGAEVHYLFRSLALSCEWAMIDYDNLTIWHDLWQGTTQIRHDPVWSGQNLAVHSLSGFVSWYVTGERKLLDNFGWRQPTPRRPLARGERGFGALELVTRFSRTWVPEKYHSAFTVTKVPGYAVADATGIKGPLPAEGGSVNAAVLDGAKLLYETTFGVNWTLNYHARIQLDYTYMVAPKAQCDAAAGTCTAGIVTGGNSDNADALTKNRHARSEHELGLRFIFRI